MNYARHGCMLLLSTACSTVSSHRQQTQGQQAARQVTCSCDRLHPSHEQWRMVCSRIALPRPASGGAGLVN